MLRLLAIALVPLALVSGSAAGGGGPLPGVITGSTGTLDAKRAVRYVAMPSGDTTAVAAVRTRDGRILRYTTVTGAFGIARVAFDGTAEGLSGDGKTLVLADVGAESGETRFAVLRTAPLRLLTTITLSGLWSYDAVSPDGRTLYAIQYISTGPDPRYAVRAVDVATGAPLGPVVVDKRNPDGRMSGSPWARVRSADGAWAYTLYAKSGGTAFVHALDTTRRRAVCIDLPWRSATLTKIRLSLADLGRTLVLTQRPLGRVATVNTRSFGVRVLRRTLP